MAGMGIRLGIYSLGHFWVDFSCALLMFGCLGGGKDWALCLLMYNFCAFAMQMPIGLAADRLSRNSAVAALGCALVGAGWSMTGAPVLCAVTAGLGNALFHVGGGIDVLNASEEKSAALGVFVSPGAFGVFLGTLWGKQEAFAAAIPLLGLVLFGCAFLLSDRLLRGSLDSGNAPLSFEWKKETLWVLGCLFSVVVLRSYMGMILAFPWKTGAWAAAAVCAVVFGKAAGGFLGDRIGMGRAGALSLGLSSLLFLFGNVPPLGVCAVFLFNMSMPITLRAAARLLPGSRGFAFGALTFALFLGFVPVYLGWSLPVPGNGGYALGALLSAILLTAGLKGGRKLWE